MDRPFVRTSSILEPTPIDTAERDASPAVAERLAALGYTDDERSE